MLIYTQQCYVCKKETQHTDGKCDECEKARKAEEKAEAEEAKASYLAGRRALPLELRLELLEKDVYDLLHPPEGDRCGESSPFNRIG